MNNYSSLFSWPALGTLIVLLLACSTNGPKQSNGVSLLDFGADPSGRQPSDQAFDQALARAVAAGSPLFVPSGTYLLTRKHELPNDFHLQGEGANSILKAGTATGGATKIAGGGMLILRNRRNITFSQIGIDINANANFATGIQIRGGENIHFDECHFYNTNAAYLDPGWTLHGIEARDINEVQITNSTSDGCQFKLCGAGGSATNILVADNEMMNCPQMGVSIVTTCRNGDQNELGNIVIRDNRFQRIDNNAIYIGFDQGRGRPEGAVDIHDLLISNNVVLESGYLKQRGWHGVLLRLSDNSRDIEVVGNRIVNQQPGSFSYGISVRYSGEEGGKIHRMSIQDNQVEGTDHGAISVVRTVGLELHNNQCDRSGRGVEIKGCEQATITENTVSNSGRGLLLRSSTALVVERNQLLDNPVGILIEAEGEEQTVEVITRENTISSNRPNAVGIRSSGEGRFTEEHDNNRISSSLRAYEQRGQAAAAQRRMNGNRIRQ